MLPYTKKQLILYTLRTGLVLLAASIHVVFFGQNIHSLSQEIAETHSKILEISRLEDRRTRLASEYSDVAGANILLDEGLPRGDNPTKFRKELDDLAARTGNQQSFSFRSDLPIPAPELPGHNYIPYSITLEGNLESFNSYLDELVKLKSFIIINSLSLRGEGKDFDSMSMQARIYVK